MKKDIVKSRKRLRHPATERKRMINQVTGGLGNIRLFMCSNINGKISIPGNLMTGNFSGLISNV